jgi:hypothetical protein
MCSAKQFEKYLKSQSGRAFAKKRFLNTWELLFIPNGKVLRSSIRDRFAPLLALGAIALKSDGGFVWQAPIAFNTFSKPHFPLKTLTNRHNSTYFCQKCPFPVCSSIWRNE